MSDVHAAPAAPVAAPPPDLGADHGGLPPPAPQATPAASSAPAPLAAPDPNAPPAAAEPPAYWPADWREKIAEHASAGDKKAYDKELRRLQNMESPYSVYGSFRGLENTWASRNFIQKPGKDAKPEEVAKYHKELGVPETPEGYFENIQLANGLVLGEADKPVADGFAAAVHKAGATPAVVSEALNWYLGNQEKAAADLDLADEQFRIEAERGLKDEFGPSFKRKTNAISTLFDIAPGGVDIKNEKALYSRVMGGRMADGKLIGNDPDMVRWLVALAMDRNPQASVVEDSDQGGRTIDAEISEIEKIMRTDRPRYNKEFANRYAQLLEAREKTRAKAR
jgi:hypothetical protein